jgi:septal ring-binding cell division protein DamX
MERRLMEMTDQERAALLEPAEAPGETQVAENTPDPEMEPPETTVDPSAEESASSAESPGATSETTSEAASQTTSGTLNSAGDVLEFTGLPSPWRLGAGVAAFLPVGESGRYGSTGAAARVFGSYSWSTGGVLLSAGALVGVSYLQLEGAVSEATTWLVPMAATLDVQLTPTSRISPTAGVAAGTGLISIERESGERSVWTVPFLSGRVGAVGRLTPRLSLTLNVGYALFWDRSLPIMGFSPEAAVEVAL